MTPSLFTFLRRSFTTSTLLLVALVASACDTGNSTTTPRPSCPPDSPLPCGVVTTGGGSNSSGGGGSGGEGSGGSSATNDVQGNVGVLNDVAFSTIAPYIGDATIITTSTFGTIIEAPYGDMAPTFTLPSVMSGSTWFFVQDQTVGATGIFSTHSVVNIPVAGQVTLPVVDRNVVFAIAGSLPAPIIVDDTKGVLVLKIVRNGQPLSGVALTTPLPGAELAYDTGIGLYSNQTKQTGPAGVILALNVDGPNAPELRDLTLIDAFGAAFFIQVRIQAGAATFAGYQL